MVASSPGSGRINTPAEAKLLTVRKNADEHMAALEALLCLARESKGPARKLLLEDLDRALTALGLTPPLPSHVLAPVAALVKDVARILQAPNKDH